MSEKLYSVFQRKNSAIANDLLFNQKGYIKRKIPYEKLCLLIMHHANRSYHFLNLGPFFLQYHVGDEFTKFLRANGVQCAEYEIEEVMDEGKGLYKKSNGGLMQVKLTWIESGYIYDIIDQDNDQPQLNFQVGKTERIKINPDIKSLEIAFVHQGTFNDPLIQKAFKEVKKSKKGDKVTGCIMVIVILILMYLLGQVWTWIFGAPDDPFNNLMSPIIWGIM